ncbi:hypothetical protein J2Y55_002824 [Bosea sp. BE125]|uniref:hypothetical protein n=1 Tax=Bosea sp. BE125 TaxID=2817909 RepID=UPI002864F43B|nr:hypothetical protein [Bosea sp. BE125]MDR6871811.1 hypothetical protein [Bosea sp. BE125]
MALNQSHHPAADLEAGAASGDDSAAGDQERISTRMEASLATSENPARQDRDGERSHRGLPAVQHSTFAKHWLAVDDGGAELMTAAFGAPARQAPQRLAPVSILHDRPAVQPAPRTHHIAPHPTRLRATVILFLLALTILFVEPAMRLFARAITVRAEAGGPTRIFALEQFPIRLDRQIALALCFNAFSSHKPASTSLENALGEAEPFIFDIRRVPARRMGA